MTQYRTQQLALVEGYASKASGGEARSSPLPALLLRWCGLQARRRFRVKERRRKLCATAVWLAHRVCRHAGVKALHVLAFTTQFSLLLHHLEQVMAGAWEA